MAMYQPLQLQDGPNKGKWHYTCTDGMGTYALGYCSKIQACPDCLDVHTSWGTYDGRDKECLRLHMEDYNKRHPDSQVRWCETCDMSRIKKLTDAETCPGHDTPEEAMKHYRQYLVDTKFQIRDREDIQERCLECNEWTGRQVCFTGEFLYHWNLCKVHATKEVLQRIYVDKEED